jgi:4-hydroxy-3-methylbut-2-en-1-yl diphosphate synthase IspG/GcpE
MIKEAKVKEKSLKCPWVFDHKTGKKTYVKCPQCGRIKREDIPDVQPCVGNVSSYKTMLLQTMGHQLTEKDISEIIRDNRED